MDFLGLFGSDSICISSNYDGIVDRNISTQLSLGIIFQVSQLTLASIPHFIGGSLEMRVNAAMAIVARAVIIPSLA
jgi:hypothetical protein